MHAITTVTGVLLMLLGVGVGIIMLAVEAASISAYVRVHRRNGYGRLMLGEADRLRKSDYGVLENWSWNSRVLLRNLIATLLLCGLLSLGGSLLFGFRMWTPIVLSLFLFVDLFGMALARVVTVVLTHKDDRKHEQTLAGLKAWEARTRAEQARQLACSHRWRRDSRLDEPGFSVNWDQYSFDEAKAHETSGLGRPRSGWRCDKCGARTSTQVGGSP